VGIADRQRFAPKHPAKNPPCVPSLLPVNPPQDTLPDARARKQPLSKDGRCRPFPQAPRPLQSVRNANYYGRIKQNGKLIRMSCRSGGDFPLATKPGVWCS
jgi:hypothetical protein